MMYFSMTYFSFKVVMSMLYNTAGSKSSKSCYCKPELSTSIPVRGGQ